MGNCMVSIPTEVRGPSASIYGTKHPEIHFARCGRVAPYVGGH